MVISLLKDNTDVYIVEFCGCESVGQGPYAH